jgi:hypothetical protein
VAVVAVLTPTTVSLAAVVAVRVNLLAAHLLAAQETRHQLHHRKVALAAIAKRRLEVALAVVALLLLALIHRAPLISPMEATVVTAQHHLLAVQASPMPEVAAALHTVLDQLPARVALAVVAQGQEQLLLLLQELPI